MRNIQKVAGIWPWRTLSKSQSTESELRFVSAHCNAAAEEIHIVTSQQSPWSTGMKNVFNLLSTTCPDFKKEKISRRLSGPGAQQASPKVRPHALAPRVRRQVEIPLPWRPPVAWDKRHLSSRGWRSAALQRGKTGPARICVCWM